VYVRQNLCISSSCILYTEVTIKQNPRFSALFLGAHNNFIYISHIPNTISSFMLIMDIMKPDETLKRPKHATLT
jgi:hypothetical protein